MAHLRTTTLLLQCNLTLHNKDFNIKSFATDIYFAVKSLDERMTKFEKEFYRNKTNIDNKEIEEMKATLKKLSNNINVTDSSIKELNVKNKELEQLSKEIKIVIETSELNMNIYKDEMRTFRNIQEEAFNKLEKYVIDVKCQSMTNNLIFSGLPYHPSKTCEEIVRSFLCKEIGIEQRVEIENVHRFGKPGPSGVRPIVVHFIYRKDLDLVLKHGYRLKGKFYSINEQFPLEIEKRRKALYPIYKRAKKEGKKAKLVRDQLYVNNVLINPCREIIIKDCVPRLSFTRAD